MSGPGFSIDWTGRGRRPEGLSGEPAPQVVSAHGGGAVVLGDCADLFAVGGRLASLGLDVDGGCATAYLDPPYNRGTEFGSYLDRQPRHEWLSFVESRLRVVHRALASR